MRKNPTDTIIELMKDMYDSSDDRMKKMFDKAILKQHQGELEKDGMGMGIDSDFEI